MRSTGPLSWNQAKPEEQTLGTRGGGGTGVSPLPAPSGLEALKFPRKQLLFDPFVPNWRRLSGLASFCRAAFFAGSVVADPSNCLKGSCSLLARRALRATAVSAVPHCLLSRFVQCHPLAKWTSTSSLFQGSDFFKL